MKKLVLPLAILVMAALVLGAFALDSTRMAADARHRVNLADGELQKHEQRLVTLLAGSDGRTPEVDSAIATYERAKDLPARHAAYTQLVVTFRQTMSTSIDPTNPLDRKFMDNVAGAINRREIAEKPLQDEWAAYQEFLSTLRGRVARWFSPQARGDWEPGK
jgi:hypothetical protein